MAEHLLARGAVGIGHLLVSGPMSYRNRLRGLRKLIGCDHDGPDPGHRCARKFSCISGDPQPDLPLHASGRGQRPQANAPRAPLSSSARCRARS
jgi:hypothetical protein